MRAGIDGPGGADVAGNGEEAATDVAEVPAVVGGGDAVEDPAALHAQMRTTEASRTPHPALRLHTCRNHWLSVGLPHIGPPRLTQGHQASARPHAERPSAYRAGQLVDRLKLWRATPKLAYLTLCEFAADVARVFVFAV